MEQVRKCPHCSNKIIGRSDKRFCTISCKTNYHYEKSRKEEEFYFQVDRQIKINRKLLKKYSRVGKTVLRQEDIKKEGFNPNYFTHYWKNKKGDTYLFVYDYGFMKLRDNAKDKYLIVQWQDYMRKG